MLLLASAVISVLMHQFDDAVSITVVRRRSSVDTVHKLGFAFVLGTELRNALRVFLLLITFCFGV